MAQAQVSPALKNLLRAIRKIKTGGKPVTQDRIAATMGRSDSAASTHLKRAQELGLVTKTVRDGRVLPGSYRLTKKGEEAAASRKSPWPVAKPVVSRRAFHKLRRRRSTASGDGAL